MKCLVMLAVIFLSISFIVISCGKDHHDMAAQPPSGGDTIPATDTLPATDTTVTVADSLPAGWHVAITPDAQLVTDVFFSNNTTGYAITGNGDVWKSTDGGLTWQENSARFSPGTQLNNLAVTDDDKVFVMMDYALEWSVSGGTFQPVYLRLQAQNTDVYFVSNDTGYVSGGVTGMPSRYCIWKTTDGGRNWNTTGVQPPPYPGTSGLICDFTFSPAGNGYQAYGPTVLHKKAGDTTWLPSATSVPVSVMSVSAPVGDIVFAVTRDGTVYKSGNAGDSFAKVGMLGKAVSGYLNLHFTSELTGYCTLNNVLCKTTDGGITWQTALTWKSSLIEVHFTDAGHGWVCGANGTILTYHP